MSTKYEEGLLRFDRMNENAWRFDMGYQSIYVETGMTLRIQLMDHFQRAYVLETPDNSLAVTIHSGKKSTHWLYRLNPNEQYPARMAAETVKSLIQQAALSQEDDVPDTSKGSDDTSDLPF